ncbi:thioredoxin domain-containing protein [Catellatospora sp. NPDC049111]|uniref:DsbA family protein n=1 Tax=Catellatospora sp. NPDC049111 TaxID=3155271 RepID=UPI00340CF817
MPTTKRPAGPVKRTTKPSPKTPSSNINTKIAIGAAGVVLFLITAIAVFARTDSPAAQPASGDGPAAASMVREDSHILDTAADGKVTVVEFLDFECEACGAAYPGVEQLRKEYEGKITYVVRYFPLPGHRNSGTAAAAAQAAANQGKFEDMYHKLFETQSKWGESQDDMSAMFAGYARELGLDMARFESDAASEQTKSRVEVDRKDGIAAGVKGTPTFFINGKKFEGRPDYAGLKQAVDAALAG